jgi:adenylosuccinate synthase
MPGDVAQLAACEPVYEAVKGWKAPTKGITSFEALPTGAQHYIRKLEEASGVRASIISTGSDREHTIVKI